MAARGLPLCEGAAVIRRNRTFLKALVTFSLVLVFSVHAYGVVTATYVLEAPSVRATTVSFELSLQLTGDAESQEQLVFFGVDVSASDDVLTRDGTDFTHFTFTKSPDLETWNLIPFTQFGPTSSAQEFETAAPSLGPGTFPLGMLSVDFASLGLTVGTTATVDIDAFDSVIGIEIPSDPSTFRFVDVGFDPGQQQFVVPEGSIGVITGLSALVLLTRRPRSDTTKSY